MDTSKDTEQWDELATKILQMNCQDLTRYLKALMLENPVMEMELPPDRAHEAGRRAMAARKMEWLEAQIRSAGENIGFFEEPEIVPDDETDHEESLLEKLLVQAEKCECTQEIHTCLKTLIGCLDANGYLGAKYEEQCAALGMDAAQVQCAVEVLQGFEPRGIGARNLVECLTLQLNPKQELERAILQKGITHLLSGEDETLAAEMGEPLEAVREAHINLRRLNPKPGYAAPDPEASHATDADVVVLGFKQQYHVMLCDFEYPAIHMSAEYLEMSEASNDPEVTSYLHEKTQQLVQVRRAIDRRGEMLVAVVKAIVKCQQRFFHGGPRYLNVLCVGNVARMAGISEETAVSVMRGKNLRCAFGVYPLSYFFIGN